MLLGLIGCTSSNLPPPAPAVVPVSVTKAEAKNVPVRVKTFGTVSTYATVAVKAQVAGQLTGVHFKEGDYVKKDQLLFTIDPRPYQAALNQAQANLKRDQANREYAQSEVRRLEGPRSSGAVTAEEYESARAKAQSLAGTVDADRAAIEIAKLQLDYRTIKSPLDGRTGNVMVQAGNLVKADDATLVVVNQVSPISVSFSVPEQYGPEIAKARREHPLDVETTIPNDNPPLHGTLTFIDNTVDPKTGTVRAETARGMVSKGLPKWRGRSVHRAVPEPVANGSSRPVNVWMIPHGKECGPHRRSGNPLAPFRVETPGTLRLATNRNRVLA